MTYTINLPSDVYNRLEQLAQGFNDTPAKAIERLLGGQNAAPGFGVIQHAHSKDYSKYLFNGSIYGKSRLVLAVIKKQATDNPNIGYDKLLELFPNHLQSTGKNPFGVFTTREKAQQHHDNTSYKRYFLQQDEIVELSDCAIAVCTQWGAGSTNNINDFIDHALTLGHDIS